MSETDDLKGNELCDSEFADKKRIERGSFPVFLFRINNYEANGRENEVYSM